METNDKPAVEPPKRPEEDAHTRALSDSSVLHLLPGDVIVLSAQGKLAKDDRKYIGEFVDRYFPRHQLLILENGARLSTIRQEGHFPFPVGPLPKYPTKED